MPCYFFYKDKISVCKTKGLQHWQVHNIEEWGIIMQKNKFIKEIFIKYFNPYNPNDVFSQTK